MQRDDDVLAVVEIAAHPFDLVGIDVGGRHLDGRRQVEDQLVVGGRLHDLGHRVADLQRHFELGAREALRRILEAIAAAGLGRHVGDHLGGVGGDLLDAGDVLLEHDAALQLAGRIVEVDDRVPGAFQRLEGAGNQLGPALHQHLQRHVGRHVALLDAPAGEVEIGLRGRRKPDLDFLEAHVEQQVEHARLALVTHRVDERLVAVAQVDRAPDRCLLDALRRPGAVVEADQWVGSILAAGVRHSAGGAYFASLVHRLFSGGPAEPRLSARRRTIGSSYADSDWQGASASIDRRELLNGPGDRR